MTKDDDLDEMDKQYKINHGELARNMVQAKSGPKNRRPPWCKLLRHGHWHASLRGWERKPRWGLFTSYYDGNWWATFHIHNAWIEVTTLPGAFGR